jgi:multidrug efflux system membrane fusion protein
LSRDGQSDLGKGTVEVIDNQINTATSTIRLKAIFPNADHRLWPNQFVKARLHLRTRQGALVVPAVAIQRGPMGSFVYVVGSERVDGAGLAPAESVAGGSGDPSRGPSLRVDGAGLAPAESVAGGSGDPSRGPSLLKAAVRPVDVDTIDGEIAIVARGLQAGEQVVTDGQSQLRPGATVQTKTPDTGGRRGEGQGRTADRGGRRAEGDSRPAQVP